MLAEVFGVGGRDGFCEFSAVSRVGDPHCCLPLFDGAFAATVAVDGEHVRDWSTPVDDRSEVVFMSKFSGG